MKSSTILTMLGSIAIGLQGVQAAVLPSILGSKFLVVALQLTFKVSSVVLFLLFGLHQSMRLKYDCLIDYRHSWMRSLRHLSAQSNHLDVLSDLAENTSTDVSIPTGDSDVTAKAV